MDGSEGSVGYGLLRDEGDGAWLGWAMGCLTLAESSWVVMEMEMG